MSVQAQYPTIDRARGTKTVNRRAQGPQMRWWLAFPALVVIWMVGMIDKTGVGVIAANPDFLSALHLHGRDADIGSLTTVTLVFYGAAMPFWGLLIDRYGSRRCVLVGLVLWGISTAVCGAAGSFTALMIGRGLLGISQGFLWPVSNSITARWFPRSERSRAKAVWIGGINLGFAMSGYVITGAVNVTDWRGGFYLLTILAVCICLPAAFFLLHDDPADVAAVSQSELDEINADIATAELSSTEKRAELLTWPYWVVVLQWVFNNIGVFGLAAWFPTYLAEQNVSGSTSNAFIAIAFALCVVVTPFVAVAMDRSGRKSIFTVVGFVIAAVTLLLAKLVTSSGFDLAMVVLAIVGIEGVTTLTGQGVLHSMAPARRMGRAAGLMSGVGNFVGAFGATIMGALIAAGGFTLAFSFLIACFLAGAICATALHLRRY